MVTGLILCFISILILIYTLTYNRGSFRSSASAVREAWSGNCRLTCQSGTQEHGPCNAAGGASTHQITKTSDRAAVSVTCMCESCPCQLMGDMVRSCRPVARVYSYFIDILAHFLLFIIRAITNTYTLLSGAIQCRAACLRQVQLTQSDHIEPAQSFTLGNKEIKKKDSKESFVSKFSEGTETADKTSKKEKKKKKLEKKDSKNSFKTLQDEDMRLKNKIKPPQEENKPPQEENKPPQEEKKPPQEENKPHQEEEIAKPPQVAQAGSSKGQKQLTDSTSEPVKNCSKCVQKGKTCIKSCPRSKNDKK